MRDAACAALVVGLTASAWGAGDARVPFPNLTKTECDAKVAELLALRIAKHNDPEGYEAHNKLVAMGSNAVPTLIYLAQQAANRDQRILSPAKHADYGWELRRPIQILVEIGDRRAIPLLSALVKHDHPKPMRMLQNLAELLCHGPDEQIAADARSSDPNVARAARMILRDTTTFEYYKRKYGKRP